MRLSLIRHGQADKNLQQIIHSPNDPSDLTELGIAQANKVRCLLIDSKVEWVGSSPENRAIRTAEIATEGLGLQIHTMQEFHERDWGVFSGRPWAEIKARLDSMNILERYSFKPEGGESWAEMDQRLLRGIRQITTMHYSSVAIFSHGGALRALVPLLLGEQKITSLDHNFYNASVTTFDYDGQNFRQVLLNSVVHLDHLCTES
jgi:broad specificity phosphatase PhoE